MNALTQARQTVLSQELFIAILEISLREPFSPSTSRSLDLRNVYISTSKDITRRHKRTWAHHQETHEKRWTYATTEIILSISKANAKRLLLKLAERLQEVVVRTSSGRRHSKPPLSNRPRSSFAWTEEEYIILKRAGSVWEITWRWAHTVL